MSYKILGKLPDPFSFESEERMSADEWYSRRDEIFEKIAKLEFGGMPKRPEEVKVVRISMPSETGAIITYLVTAKAGCGSISFLLDISAPSGPIDGSVRYPVMLTGDGCYNNCESDVIRAAQERGIAVARFNRLIFANDYMYNGRTNGIYELFPENDSFSAISAWAWGYSVAVDALLQIPHVDGENIGITGHSRGGKTVLLAAAADTRIKFVCANNSGCHGAASHRLIGLDEERSETLADMIPIIPHWLGKELFEFAGKEETLPYDMHFFGALIAPRYYMQAEGMQDYWINPRGAWYNFLGVRAAYEYLGCSDNAAAWFRPGTHRHKLPDFTEFLNFMKAKLENKPTPEHFKINPYPDMDLKIEW